MDSTSKSTRVKSRVLSFIIFKKASLILSSAILLMALSSCGGEKTTTPPKGALKAEPSNIQFGADLPVNTESKVEKITISNSSSVDVDGISYGLEKGQDKIFLVGSNCTNKLVAGASCTVSASIKPDQKGKAYSDTFFIKYKSASGEETLRVRLTGSTLSSGGVEIFNNLFISGTDSTESLTKTFPDTSFGSVSDVATLGVTYSGVKPVVVEVVPPTDNAFRTVTDCVELKSGERCNIFVTFAPVATGAVSSSVIINSLVEGDADKKVDTLSLVGSGTVPPALPSVTLTEKATGAKSVDFGSVIIGDLSPEKEITLTNNSETQSYLYRLASTLSYVSVDYGTCTGRILPKGSCVFKLAYGPSTKGNSGSGYISFISGRSISYIEVKGSATEGTPSPFGDLTVDKTAIKFPTTDLNFGSEIKVIKLVNSKNTPSGKITMSLSKLNSAFSYTTTCVDGGTLRANGSCDINLSFRPIKLGNDTDTLTISVGKSTTASPTSISVNLSGTGRAQSITDNTTNIPNLTVSMKRLSFSDTGVGLKSAAHQFTLTNTGKKPITGFVSTSTDLIRFPIDSELTSCTNTIPAESSCVIAYKFNATGATTFNGYVKVWADGLEGTVDDAPELIELVGRGVLFNQYIYFGYVSTADKLKDVTYAAVNETAYARKITRTEIETVRWMWDARKANPLSPSDETNSSTKSAKMQTWFPSKTDDISKYFTRKHIGTYSAESTTGTPYFFIVSDTCKGFEVQSGGSCIMKLRYDTTKLTDNESKAPVSAYVRLYTDVDGTEVLVDQFHAVASGVDNVTYFFPPEDKIGNKSYERPIVIWDSQGVVIDQNIYTYSGANSYLPSGYNADNKVRRYDAARNAWVSLKTSGTDYMAMKWSNGVDGDQIRMVQYNKKLYFYGGQLKSSTGSLLGVSDYLGVLDLDAKTADIDGVWSTLSLNSAPGGRGQVNLAGYNNRLYLWGGLQRFPRNVYFYDLRENKWLRAGQESSSSISIADIPEGCTIPQDGDKVPTRRGYAAIIFYGNKLFVQGGMHSIRQDDKSSCGSLTMDDPNREAYLNNDLWTYEVESYNDKGQPIHSAEVNTWKRLTDIIGGNSSVGLDPAPMPAEDEKRPYAREKHEWDIVGNKLLLKASGFSPANGNGLVNVGPGNYYFFFDPASGGKTTDNPYNGWTKANIDTSSLAQHKLFVIGGVIWFYNKNVMGVQVNSEIEAEAKK